jgi:tRNA pseudouridine55 synthase
MARRRKGTPVHGWIVLDKPSAMTSTYAVSAVRRIYDAQKAGHAGTLDPLATGVLPIALGEATKTVSFAVDGAKAYRFEVRWGVETTTDDAEGSPQQTSEKRPGEDAILDVIHEFTGEIMQVPPRFSAIKVEGNRAYDLARSGEDVVLEARPVVIDTLRLIGLATRDGAVFEAECGKGTYVRALARDMGRRLGCYGHVVALRRTRVGPFSEDDGIGLDELRRMAEAGDGGVGLAECLLPVTAALSDLVALPVGQGDAARIARGQGVLIRGRDAPILTGPAYAVFRGQPLAIGMLEQGEFRPGRVFNLG